MKTALYLMPAKRLTILIFVIMETLLITMSLILTANQFFNRKTDVEISTSSPYVYLVHQSGWLHNIYLNKPISQPAVR